MAEIMHFRGILGGIIHVFVFFDVFAVNTAYNSSKNGQKSMEFSRKMGFWPNSDKK